MGLVIAALLAIGSPEALAGKKVVLMDFDGPNAGSVRSALVRTLRGNHDVVPRSTLIAEARKMGFSTRCDANIVSGVASVVGADAVLCGTVTGSRRPLLALRVFNGGDGKIVTSLRVKLDRAGVNASVLDAISARVEPALVGTWNWDAVEVKSEQSMAPARTPRPSVEADPVEDLPKTGAAATVAEANAWENNDSENPLAAPAAARRPAPVLRSAASAPRRAEGEHALRLSVGPAMMLRRNYAVYHATPDKVSAGWQTTPVAGLALDAEVYPAAWFSRGWATHLGLGLSYKRYFGLSWRNSGNTEDTAATHQVFSVDLRGRYALSLGARRLSFLVRGGFRHLGFSMNDVAENRAVIPDVAFNSLDLGAAVDFTILPRWLTVCGYVDYLPVFGRGEIVTFDEFGPGRGSGLRLGGGLRGSVSGGFGWQLELDYSRYAVRFDGNPDARRAGEQATIARDRYLSSTLLLTYTN